MNSVTPIPISVRPAAVAQIDLLARTYDAFRDGNVPALLESFAPGALWVCHGAPHLPCGGNWHGHAGLVAFLKALGGMAEVLAFAPGPIQALPDGRVMAEGYERLRFRATGIEATTRWLHLFCFRDGLIAKGVEWNEGAVLAAAHRGG